MTQKPRSITIIGGGFIAVELGHFFAAAGVHVTVLSRSPLLKEYDPDIRSEFMPRFLDTINVHEGCNFSRISHQEGKFITAATINGQPLTIKSDQLLVAAGMIPNSDILEVQNGNIKTDDSGNIVVDSHLETSSPNVWAFGDIIGTPYFRHKTNFEAEHLFHTLFTASNDEPIQYPPMPWALFTYPQVAGFGPTEAELTQQGMQYVVGKAAYKDSGMGMAFRSEYGFVKLIFDADTQRLLAASAIGPQAATMIHMPIAFAKMNATLADMLSTIYIHPALPEIVRNAVRKADAAFKK